MINFDSESTTGRGALNFTQKYIGGGGIQVAANLDARYFGSATNVTNLSAILKSVIGANNSGTSTSGARSQIDIDSSLAFTQGTHNIYGLDIITSAVGGTHTGGTITRVGINQAPFSALTCSGATCRDWGARFGNDVAITAAGAGLYVKEGSNATMGTCTLSAGALHCQHDKGDSG